MIDIPLLDKIAQEDVYDLVNLAYYARPLAEKLITVNDLYKLAFISAARMYDDPIGILANYLNVDQQKLSRHIDITERVVRTYYLTWMQPVSVSDSQQQSSPLFQELHGMNN